MQTLLSLPYLTIHLHPTPVPVLEVHWLGFATSAEFCSAAQQALALGQQHRVQGWIADDRLLGAVRPRDLDWVHHQVLEPLSQLGLRRFARLEAADGLNRLTIGGMYARAGLNEDLHFTIRCFSDLEEARTWVAGS